MVRFFVSLSKYILMKKISTFIFLFLVIFCCSQKVEYPIAKEGYKKIEFKLPKKDNYRDYMVEIFVTFMTKATKCDTPSSTVKLEREYLLSGNRYIYYEVKNKNVETVIMMNGNCGEKIDKKAYNYPLLEEYRSGIPYVCYIPQDMDIEYRIWKVEPKYIIVK